MASHWWVLVALVGVVLALMVILLYYIINDPPGYLKCPICRKQGKLFDDRDQNNVHVYVLVCERCNHAYYSRRLAESWELSGYTAEAFLKKKSQEK